MYALKDPRTSEIRYIGWTKKDPEDRLRKHINRARSESVNNHVQRWLLLLGDIGLTPSIEILERGQGPTWGVSEAKWIKHYRNLGAALTNLTDGGDGTTGRIVSKSECAAISERAKKRWASMTPERRTEVGERIASAGGVKRFWGNMTKEERADHARKRWVGMSPEQRTEFAKRRASTVSPERWKEIAKRRNARFTPEELSARARSMAKIYWDKKRAQSA